MAPLGARVDARSPARRVRVFVASVNSWSFASARRRRSPSVRASRSGGATKLDDRQLGAGLEAPDPKLEWRDAASGMTARVEPVPFPRRPDRLGGRQPGEPEP